MISSSASGGHGRSRVGENFNFFKPTIFGIIFRVCP